MPFSAGNAGRTVLLGNLGSDKSLKLQLVKLSKENTGAREVLKSESFNDLPLMQCVETFLKDV